MFLQLFFVVAVSALAQSANILVVNPTPAYSHFIVPFTIAKELANRGHKVTSISSYPQRIGKKIKNFEDVPVVENIPLMEDLRKELFTRSSRGFLDNLTTLFNMMWSITNSTIHHKNVQNLLQSEKQFDVVIMEHFLNEAFVGFGYRFKAPVVFVSSQGSSPMNNYIFANPAPMSYVPGSGGTLTNHMNFWQRIQNLLANSFFQALIQFYHLPQQRKMFKSYITEDVEFDDVLYNTSLMLTNSHVSISNPVPHTPNIIDVGGVHVIPKPLPDDLQKFMDDAKDGVILFSMGSNLRSENLKAETREAIVKAFSKLKQKVLWKFETDLPNAPDNVIVSNWFPQQDILAHPNVRAFITHGGRLSTIEAIYFGVPIIGIPVFGDQLSNVATAVADGYGIKLSLDEITEEVLSGAIHEILTNPKYKNVVQKRSQILHDQPLTPIDTAVFWVEHVIRNQGAPHMRSAGLDLKWYQREMIDVFAFLLSIFAVMTSITYVVIKKLWQCVTGKKVVVSKKKKHQ